MELFPLACTKKTFGAYCSVEKIAVGTDARQYVRYSLHKTIAELAVNKSMTPAKRPKFFATKETDVDPLGFANVIHLGWKGDFYKWANFLQVRA